VKSVLICGVGGQGILLASDILADVALETGYDVKKSEVHGMAQRGGSVVSHVRYGEKVHAPLIGVREADIVLSFERLEALRNIDYLSDEGTVILNDFEILPLPCSAGLEEYPGDILENLRAITPKIEIVEGNRLAVKAGSGRAVNVVLLGSLAKYLDLPRENWLKVIERKVPPKTRETNMAAFEFGFSGDK
jgi:indolepyruvate ferredoxin oxidoreductase beta subunit